MSIRAGERPAPIASYGRRKGKNMRDYLKDILPGDTIVIQPYSSWYERPYYFAKILAVGKAKIKTDKGNFSAIKGHKLPGDYYSSDRITDMVVEQAEVENKRIDAEQLRIAQAHALSEIHWRDQSAEVINAVMKLVKGK